MQIIHQLGWRQCVYETLCAVKMMCEIAGAPLQLYINAKGFNIKD